MVKMTYPQESCLLTRRSRQQVAALSRRAAGDPTPPQHAGRGVEMEPARLTARGLSMPLALFREFDYGLLCQHLGLRPSQPHRNAEGRDARKRPRRRR